MGFMIGTGTGMVVKLGEWHVFLIKQCLLHPNLNPALKIQVFEAGGGAGDRGERLLTGQNTGVGLLCHYAGALPLTGPLLVGP